ncbi:MAG: RNA methyltransferase [Patescibacteria group bacterium]
MQKIKAVAKNRQSGLAVVLEDIHDPHNAEAVFRSCEAFGVQEVYLIFDRESPFNPKRIGKKTSGSANKWLNFHIYKSAKECFADLKAKRYFLAATVLDKGASSIYKARLSQKKLALIFGNEHRGLSAGSQKLSDHKLFIPMRGMVQSLNLSVTAGIFLYEISRQRENHPDDYRLTSIQFKKLVSDFKQR